MYPDPEGYPPVNAAAMAAQNMYYQARRGQSSEPGSAPPYDVKQSRPNELWAAAQ